MVNLNTPSPSGDCLLMVIQDIQAFDPFPAYVFSASFGKFDFDNWKDDLLQVVQVLHVYLKGKQGREFLLEGFQEALTRGVAADVGGGMKIIPEKDFLNANDLF